MKQLLTNSSLTTFKACPRRYQFQYEMGYVSAQDSEALNLGKLVHAGLEGWAKNNRDLQSGFNFISLESQKYEIDDPYLRSKALAMVEGYHHRYKEEPYETIHAELEFRAPLLNPETTALSKTYEMGGKMDRIVKNASGRFYLLETKTTMENIEDPSSDYWLKLALDSQVSTYYLGAEASGINIESCLYDVLRKPGLRPYKVGKQRKTDETAEEYYLRLRNEIMVHPDHYYARREIPRSKEDLAEFLFDVWGISQTLMSYQNKGKFPRNTNACTSHYGRCPYLDVCSGRTNLDNQTLFQKLEGNKHRELSPA